MNKTDNLYFFCVSCNLAQKDEVLIYGKNLGRQLEQAGKNVKEAIEWSLQKAGEPFTEQGGNQVEALKKKVELMYEDLWEQLEKSRGFATDIIASIWLFERDMVTVAGKVCAATRVVSSHYKSWKKEWDNKPDRGEWVDQEAERLRNEEWVPDLWSNGYLGMVKEVTKEYRNAMDDVIWGVCELVEDRKAREEQAVVTKGIHKLSQTVSNITAGRGHRGDGDGGGRHSYGGRGVGGRFGGGRDGGGKGHRPGVQEEKMLPQNYVNGPMRDMNWCVHYTRQLLLGGTAGCFRGGKGQRCFRGSHHFEVAEAKAHYNAWAAQNGENSL